MRLALPLQMPLAMGGHDLALGRAPDRLITTTEYSPLAALGTALHGYFDARRADSMTLVGSQVSEWRCLKTGYVTTQPTGTARPILSKTFGGDSGLFFDGIDDCLVGVSHPYPLSNVEVWLLLSQDSLPADTQQRYAFGMGTGSGLGATMSRVVTSGVNRPRATVGNGTVAVNSTNLSVDFSTRHVLRMLMSPTGVKMEIDGVTIAEAAVVSALSNARFRFGAFINTLPGNFYLGQIAAALITGPLSAAQSAPLNTWLMSRRKL